MGQAGSPGGGPRLSRRGLFAGAGTAGFAGLSLWALDLPVFDVAGARQDPSTCHATDVSASDPALVISNWAAYIDPRKKPDSTFSVFEQTTGITVTYNDDVNDNAEFYAKVKNQMASCQTIDRDIIVLTDWMAARMIDLGWIQPLDPAAIGTCRANVLDSLRGLSWDPDFTYHVPWQSGLTGIAYNRKYVDAVGSFSELLTRPDLKGRVTLLSEMRDSMGFVLRTVGADPSDFTPTQWGQAIEAVTRAVSDGQIRSIIGQDYLDDLASGNTLACEAWSGDVIQAQLDNPDIVFVTPEEGLALWSDNMLVPNLATHQSNAQAWMDYYYDPQVAAKLAAWNNYICPVQGAQQAMEQVDPSLVDNPLIFPDAETLAQTFYFMPLDLETSTEYERDWADVQGG